MLKFKVVEHRLAVHMRWKLGHSVDTTFPIR